MSHVSIAQPPSPPPTITRSPARVELRFGVEANAARRLLSRGLNAEIPPRECDSKGAAITLQLKIAPAGFPSHVRVAAWLAEQELALVSREVDVTITHGPRMVHVDAHERGSHRIALSISLEHDSGRVVFAQSNIPAEVGLPGGTYEPPAVAIQWE